MTDAHGQRETLLHGTVQRGTGEIGACLAVLRQEGEDCSTQLDGMTMPPIAESSFLVALRSLEQAVDGRTMDQSQALTSRLLN